MMRWNVLANYVASLWGAAMGILLIPLYVDALGVESYGMVGLLATLQAGLVIFDLGLGQALAREMARTRAGLHDGQSIRDLLVSVASVYGGISILVIASLTILSSWLAVNWLNPVALSPDTIAQALALSGLLVCMRWISGLVRGGLMGLEYQVAASTVNIVSATLRGLGTLAALHLVEATLAVFILFQTTVTVGEIFVTAWLLHRRLPHGENLGRFRLDALLRVRHFAVGTIGISIVAFLLSQVDKIVLSKMLDLDDFGYYTLAAAIAAALYMFITPVTSAIGPRLVRHIGSGDPLEAPFRSATHLIAWTVFPIGLTACVFSDHLLMMWTNSLATVNRLALTVSLLCLGTTFNALMQLPYLLEIGFGRTRLLNIVNLVALAIFIPMIYIGVRYIGFLAGGVSWAALNLLYLAFAAPIILRRALPGRYADWLIHGIGPTFVGVGGTLLALRLAIGPPLHDESRLTSFIVLLIVAPLAVIASTICNRTGHLLLRLIIQHTGPTSRRWLGKAIGRNNN